MEIKKMILYKIILSLLPPP